MLNLKLDPPIEFRASTYLGCQQEEFKTTLEDAQVQAEFGNPAFADQDAQFKTAGDTLLTELRDSNQSKRKSRKQKKDAQRKHINGKMDFNDNGRSEIWVSQNELYMRTLEESAQRKNGK